MKIMEKLTAKERNVYGEPPITLAFLGDSVTHGCFELYRVGKDGIDTVFEAENSYAQKVNTILHTLYPRAQLNIIGAGISGDCAANGLTRIDRDVTPFHPDLTVVCYGLNDCGGGENGLEKYRDSMTGIIRRLREIGSEVIVMTPNTMCFHTSAHVRDELITQLTTQTEQKMTDGILDRYVDAARAVAAAENAPLCDVYAIWKQLENVGVNTTELLANYINHPMRNMHWVFAYELVKTMLFC